MRGKNVLNHPAHRQDVQLVDAGIDIVHDKDPDPAFFQDPAGLVLHGDISGVDDRGADGCGGKRPGVVQDRVPVAEIDPAGQQNDVRIDPFDVFQIFLLEFSGRGRGDHGPGAQGGLPGGFDRHVRGQPVNGHPQTARRRGGGQPFGAVGVQAVALFQVPAGALQTDPHVSGFDAGQVDPLSQEPGAIRFQVRKRGQLGDGAADVGDQQPGF